MQLLLLRVGRGDVWELAPRIRVDDDPVRIANFPRSLAITVGGVGDVAVHRVAFHRCRRLQTGATSRLITVPIVGIAVTARHDDGADSMRDPWVRNAKDASLGEERVGDPIPNVRGVARELKIFVVAGFAVGAHSLSTIDVRCAEE